MYITGLDEMVDGWLRLTFEADFIPFKMQFGVISARRTAHKHIDDKRDLFIAIPRTR